jgi:hypothetical protein
MVWLAFFIGLVAGGVLGIIVISLLTMGSVNSRAPGPVPPEAQKSEAPDIKKFQDQGSQMKKMAVLFTVAILAAEGCSGMSYTEQRVLSGGAMGAAGGALIGAAAGSAAIGAAAGGGAGLLGGYAYDQYQKSLGKP